MNMVQIYSSTGLRNVCSENFYKVPSSADLRVVADAFDRCTCYSRTSVIQRDIDHHPRKHKIKSECYLSIHCK